MADKKPFLEAIAARRTIYTISPENLPVPTSRVQEIITQVIKHTPSPYNAQTARAVIIFDDNHRKYFDAVESGLEKILPPEVWSVLSGSIKSFRSGGAGTVLWFEDEEAIEKLTTTHPAIAPFAESWSDQSNGMHQINAWTALEAEGLGASLQHHHFAPDVMSYYHDALKVPKTWKPKAQLVFGTPTAPAGDKAFEPIEGKRLVLVQ
ncbi:uncharacterized protein HMPREF1541_07737 [Cyphellophora europaea CBS 101466]|uniref:Nitroreductase domain-containing protein n=1 Tax=Cyphellophora europaea (strain CBS 101466) TaxID=1220924 RepID=W2RQW5_CYPE1|nr:uncharacterized protein HMPREF1541_07737 [Cyphellophora europaea CBS 101466]ETN38113.1 hypothetical protein HMPREF1541_07737 [Cyphellophora europaea CBS 101466]